MLKLRTVLALLAMAFCASCQLQNGIVVTGQTSSAGGVSFAYYNFTSTGTGSIKVIVTALSAQDPDLFVSLTANPGPANHRWSGQRIGGDSITIDPVDACPSQTTCQFFIGVEGFANHAVAFALVWAQEPQHVQLQVGTPQFMAVSSSAGQTFDYAMPLNGGSHLLFDLSNIATTGYATMYIGTGDEDPNPAQPGSYNWTVTGHPALVAVRSTDRGFCTGCTYRILVTTMETDLAVELRVTTSSQRTWLIPGTPLYDFVQGGSFAQYYFYIESSVGSLSLTATALQGNPDMYVNVGSDFSHPWPTNAPGGYMFKADSLWSADTVVITESDRTSCAGATWCFVQITVYAANQWGMPADTVFYLSGSMLGDVVTISPGSPVSASLGNHQYKKFKALVSGSVGDDVAISVVSGGTPCNLFVSTVQMPYVYNSSSYEYSQYYVSPAFIDLSLTAASQWIYFVVQAEYGSGLNFTVRVASANLTDTLQDGVPLMSVVDSGHYKYFRAQFTKDQDIHIDVTRLGGDPDLYVSITNPQPTAADHTWASAYSGGDRVTIDALSVPPFSTFYIGVYGYHALSRFSIVASTGNSTLELINGVPVTGSAPAGRTRYYSVHVGDSLDPVVFQLYPNSGSPTLYVSTTGIPDPAVPSSYQWHAYGAPPIVVQASPTDPGYCSSCIYYIAVSNRYAWGGTNYTISAASANDSTLVVPGVQSYGSATVGGDFAYFYTVVEAPGDVEISIVPLNGGDPDLYVSATTPHPTIFNYTWEASNSGEDTLVIPAADTRYRRGTRLYIGVRAFGTTAGTACRFMLTVAAINDTISLIPGIPQRGYLHSMGAYNRYEVSFVGATDITFTLSPSSGSGAIYVSRTRLPDPSDPSSYQIVANTGNPTVLRVPPTHPLFCVNCIWTISVASRYSWGTLNYTLVASGGNSSVTLLEGVPQHGTVAVREFTYFRFLSSTNENIAIAVTALQGDPDVFVSTATTHPSQGSFQWASSHQGGDFVEIKTTDASYCATTPARQCTYYVGVYGYPIGNLREVSFMISVRYGNEPTSLIAGLPQDGHADPGKLAFFKFAVQLGTLDHISFIVNSPQGSPAVYVSTRGLPDPATPSSYQWSSTQGSGLAIITIHYGDPNYCNSCEYLVGVESQYPNRGLNFTVTGTQANQSLTLQEGVSQSGFVVAGDSAYYRVQFAEAGPIHISVTAYSGDPDIFVSTVTTEPSLANSTWRSRTVGDDEIVISPEDPHYVEGATYYIGVQAYVAPGTPGDSICSFVITASTGDTPIDLPDGVTLSGTASAGQTRRYTYYPSEFEDATPDITITLNPEDADNQPLLIASTETWPHNLTEAMWTSTLDSRGVIQTITIPSSDPGYCIDCPLYISVINDLWYDSNYTITGSTSTTTISLQIGVPYVSSASSGSPAVFEVYLSRPESLIVSATPLAGGVRVYASQSGVPTPTSFTWPQAGDPLDGFLHIDEPTAGDLFLAVYAVEDGGNMTTAIDFSITVNYRDAFQPVALESGIAHHDIIQPNKAAFYTFELGTSVVAIAAQGDVEMKIEVDFDSFSQPDPDYVSQGTNPAFVIITPTPANVGRTLYVTVLPLNPGTGADVRVMATSEGETSVLAIGQPSYGYVAGGSTVYYVVSNVYKLTVSNYVGEVEIYASTTNRKPNSTDTSKWALTGTTANNTIVFGGAVAVTQNVYIGVRGATPGTNEFSLLAATADSWVEIYRGSGAKQAGTTVADKAYTHYYTDPGTATSVTVKITVASADCPSAAGCLIQAYASTTQAAPPISATDKGYTALATGPAQAKTVTLTATIPTTGVVNATASSRVHIYVRDTGVHRVTFSIEVVYTDSLPPGVSTTPKPSSKRKGKGGVIAGAIIGTFLIVGAIAGTILFIQNRRQGLKGPTTYAKMGA